MEDDFLSKITSPQVMETGVVFVTCCPDRRSVPACSASPALKKAGRRQDAGVRTTAWPAPGSLRAGPAEAECSVQGRCPGRRAQSRSFSPPLPCEEGPSLMLGAEWRAAWASEPGSEPTVRRPGLAPRCCALGRHATSQRPCWHADECGMAEGGFPRDRRVQNGRICQNSLWWYVNVKGLRTIPTGAEKVVVR